MSAGWSRRLAASSVVNPDDNSDTRDLVKEINLLPKEGDVSLPALILTMPGASCYRSEARCRFPRNRSTLAMTFPRVAF